MRDTTLLFWVLLLVQGVVGDTDGVKPVSVMEGDSVTLNPDPTDLEGDEEIIWKFGNEIIAKMKETFYGIIYTKDVMFRDRLDLDKQTGSLTITNIRTEHIGHYSVDIRTSTGAKLKTFQVTVHGGVKTVSVKEGESVILHTGVTEIQGYDQILWKIEDNLIAEINKGTKQFLIIDKDNKKFNSRLQMHHQSGSLIISDSATKDSGVYHLNMISSSHTIKRTISVTVSVSGRSGAVSGISGASVVLMVWAVTVVLLQEV